MNFKPMMSEIVLHYDLTGAQLPADKFVLTLFAHHEYPPEPSEYFQKILNATINGGVLGFICTTMLIEAPASTALIYLSRKGENLPDDFEILRVQNKFYEVREEFRMRGVMPILDGLEPMISVINSRFLASRIYHS